MKLWQKGYDLDQEVEQYTVGGDFRLDQALVEHDCTASIVHARVLHRAGVLSATETETLIKGLEQIIELNRKGDFVIKSEDEDCHTAIENHLVSELGDIGKKIHTARSRNDQVVTAMRLYSKARLKGTRLLIDELIVALNEKISASGNVILPGYTHTRKAMPSSVGMWLGSFVESMEDNKLMLDAARDLIDQNPLGTGAGYGIPVFELDREFSTKALGFKRVQNNPVYVQNSRGKFEANMVSALVNVMADLNRMATDLILFTMDEIGYFSLPREICTGSSIMPHKFNPDVLEIMRARYHEVAANEFAIRTTVSNLISGYNRDLQLTKKPLMESFDVTDSSLGIMILVSGRISVNSVRCESACTRELFATEKVYMLVKEGVPFREAYRLVAAESDRTIGSSG